MMITGQERGLACEGAGIRGLAYVPIIEKLEALGVISGLRAFAGTSAGSHVAALLACGASARFVRKLLESTSWSKLITRPSLIGLARKWGLRGTDKLDQWVGTWLAELTGSRDVAFDDLDLDLYVTAVCVDTRRLEVFSRSSTPGAKIREAIVASSAIPGFFRPVTIGGLRYVDGGLLLPYPVELLRDLAGLSDSQIVGIRIDSPNEVAGSFHPVESLGDYFGSIVEIGMAGVEARHYDETLYKERTIRAVVGGVGATDFDLSKGQRAMLLAAGRMAADLVK